MNLSINVLQEFQSYQSASNGDIALRNPGKFDFSCKSLHIS
jgi:hypothetical protein